MNDFLSDLSLFLGLKSELSDDEDEEELEAELEPEHEEVKELRIASSDAINL